MWNWWKSLMLETFFTINFSFRCSRNSDWSSHHFSVGNCLKWSFLQHSPQMPNPDVFQLKDGKHAVIRFSPLGKNVPVCVHIEHSELDNQVCGQTLTFKTFFCAVFLEEVRFLMDLLSWVFRRCRFLLCRLIILCTYMFFDHIWQVCIICFINMSFKDQPKHGRGLPFNRYFWAGCIFGPSCFLRWSMLQYLVYFTLRSVTQHFLSQNSVLWSFCVCHVDPFCSDPRHSHSKCSSSSVCPPFMLFLHAIHYRMGLCNLLLWGVIHTFCACVIRKKLPIEPEHSCPELGWTYRNYGLHIHIEKREFCKIQLFLTHLLWW